MMLRDDLIQRLQDLAERKHLSIDEIVEEMLNRYSDDLDNYPLGSSARLAAAGRNMPPFGPPENTSEHADDILRAEFGDYLLARMNPPLNRR